MDCKTKNSITKLLILVGRFSAHECLSIIKVHSVYLFALVNTFKFIIFLNMTKQLNKAPAQMFASITVFFSCQLNKSKIPQLVFPVKILRNRLSELDLFVVNVNNNFP